MSAERRKNEEIIKNEGLINGFAYGNGIRRLWCKDIY